MTDQRTALVTGGNRGIGLAICDGLIDRDLHVVMGSRSEARGEEAAAPLPEGPGVGRAADPKRRPGAKGAQVDRAAESVGAVERRGGAVHYLHRAEQHRRQERQVEVPDLGIGNRLSVQQERGLGGPGAAQGGGGQLAVAVPPHEESRPGLEGGRHGGGPGAREGDGVDHRDAGRGLGRRRGQAAGRHRERRQRPFPLHAEGVVGRGRRRLGGPAEGGEAQQQEGPRQKGDEKTERSGHTRTALTSVERLGRPLQGRATRGRECREGRPSRGAVWGRARHKPQIPEVVGSERTRDGSRGPRHARRQVSWLVGQRPSAQKAHGTGTCARHGPFPARTAALSGQRDRNSGPVRLRASSPSDSQLRVQPQTGHWRMSRCECRINPPFDTRKSTLDTDVTGVPFSSWPAGPAQEPAACAKESSTECHSKGRAWALENQLPWARHRAIASRRPRTNARTQRRGRPPFVLPATLSFRVPAGRRGPVGLRRSLQPTRDDCPGRPGPSGPHPRGLWLWRRSRTIVRRNR